VAFGTNRVGATAPVTRSVFWVMVSMVAWELFQGLRIGATVPTGSWPLSAVDLVFLVLIPALCAFAFIRLFLVLTQTARGTLNVYAALSSPWAWVFWLGICSAMIGHGVHVAGNAAWRQLNANYPGLLGGPLASALSFLDKDFGYGLLGCGILLLSVATLFLGHDASQRLYGIERVIFVVGSLATYGVLGILLGVGAHQYIPTIAATAILTVIGVLLVPPSEIINDPVTAFIVPGSLVSGLVVLIWTLAIGGQPTFG
jgi:hypothetical protein